MKKIVLILSAVFVILTGSMSFATENVKNEENMSVSEISEDKDLTQPAEKILSNMSNKERKIAEYTDKYNDKALGTTAYYLDVVRVYSIPVWIICLAIGGFNFGIIGEKKLDKREQGFGFIVASLCGFAISQVLPLIFALLVAGK